MQALKSLMTAGLFLAAATGQGWSETYKIAHQFPATHYLWVHGAKIFADEVKSLSGDKITFEDFPGGQLGKDYYTLIQSNVADMVLISTSSISAEKFPLSSVVELPGYYASACEGTNKFWALSREDGMLGQEEYTPQNLHMLFVAILVPYSIMTSNKPVRTIDDLKGLKIRGNGAAQENLLTALGAVPVKVGSTEVYDAVSRGTVDGALYPFSGVQQYSLEKVMHHAALGPQLGAGATVFAMTKSKWDALPDETKKIFEQAASKAQENLCQWLDDNDSKVQEEISRSGFSLNRLPDDEIQKWHDAVAPVAAFWAEQMNGKGLKGSAVLDAFKNAK